MWFDSAVITCYHLTLSLFLLHFLCFFSSSFLLLVSLPQVSSLVQRFAFLSLPLCPLVHQVSSVCSDWAPPSFVFAPPLTPGSIYILVCFLHSWLVHVC